MSATRRETAPLPRWTKYVVTQLGGRDPLGLSRLAQLLADGLMPGIITTTNRARYYSLYCWILWHIEQEENPASAADYMAGFQRREAAVALGTRLLSEQAEPPVGLRAVTRQLDMPRPDGTIDTAFQVLPANRLGGFGQYYAGCLYNLSLTERTADGIDRITKGTALDLATAVHHSIRTTPYIRERHFSRPLVPTDVIEASAERMSINAIVEPFAAEERRLLNKLFFGADDAELDAETRSRRESLLRILATVDAYENAGLEIAEKTLPMQLVYYPTYFGVLRAGTKKPVLLTVPVALQRCSEDWRQFALHQFLTQALESLLEAMLIFLAARVSGATRREIAEQVTRTSSTGNGDFVEYLERLHGKPCATPAALLGALQLHRVPDEAMSLAARARYSLDHALGEAVWEAEATGPSEIAARACLLLSVIYAKWRGIENDRALHVTAERAGAEVCARSFLPLLDAWLDPQLEWTSALERLFALIHKQHDVVMFDKGRLESSWLRSDGNRLYFDQNCERQFRSTRHTQAVHILVDIGLLEWAHPRPSRESTGLRLTTDGRRQLRAMLRDS